MAAVYSAGDFRNGTTFEMEGNVYRVVEFQHVKPGKGAAFVRTKLKNVITGAVLEKTFNPSDKFPGAEIEKKVMQYLYNDGDLYYFMDNETYDQMPLNKEQLAVRKSAESHPDFSSWSPMEWDMAVMSVCPSLKG